MKTVEVENGDTVIIQGASSKFILQDVEFVEYSTKQSSEYSHEQGQTVMTAAFIKIGSLKFKIETSNFKQEREKAT